MLKKISSGYLLSVLALIVCLSGTVLSQQVSRLLVSAVDPSGAVVTNFRVSVKLDGKVIAGRETTDSAEIVITKLPFGEYHLEAEATGFKLFTSNLSINTLVTKALIRFEIQSLNESVSVENDKRVRAIQGAFSNILTQQEIDNLPEDSEEMRRVLKQKAGGGSVIFRVDGFPSTDLPNKSQIASVRIVRSSFDAENHELGSTYVDIVTKAGSRQLNGSAAFTFNDESLNARNPFSSNRLPEQTRDINFYLSGPLVKNRTDFFGSFYNSRNFAVQNIFAALPTGTLNEPYEYSRVSTFGNITINHNLWKDVPIKLGYLFSNNRGNDLGVGGFNLPERAFDSANRSHELRFSTQTILFEKYLNEFRFQFKDSFLMTEPKSNAPTVNVLNSFQSGGAGNRQNQRDKMLTISNNFLFGISNHALKIGGSFSIISSRSNSAINENGTFIYPSLEAFTSSSPSMFSQSEGERVSNVKQIRAAAFIQDDFQIKKNLILSGGIRYEVQNNLRDLNNFSPRLAFSWSPFKSASTTLRGGVGVFYNWLEPKSLLMVRNQDQSQPGETIILNPSNSNINLDGSIVELPPSFMRLAPNISNPYVFHTSMGFEHQLFKSTSIRAEYVFQKGLHQFRSRNINAPNNGIRANPQFGNIDQLESSSFFVRNSLTVGLLGELTKRFTYSANYSLSKLRSESDGDFSPPSDNFNLRKDFSYSDEDQRHRLNIDGSIRVIKRLYISANYSINSPKPYNITTGLDNNGDTVFDDRPESVIRNSARKSWNKQFDARISYTISFGERKGGSGGGRMIAIGVGEGAGSIGDLSKKYSLNLFIRASNLFNNVNYRDYVGVQSSPFFEKPISAEPARQIYGGIRFSF